MSLSFLKQELYEANVQGNALGRFIPGKVHTVDRKLFGSHARFGSFGDGEIHALSERKHLIPFFQPVTSSMYCMDYPGSPRVLKFVWPPSLPDPTPFKGVFLIGTTSTVTLSHRKPASAETSYDSCGPQNRDG
jgi:hypothetical protein